MGKVLNKRTDKIPPDAIYVGRPSKWGNPARIGLGVPREVAIDLYRAYLGTEQGQKLLEDIGELRGKDLVCWCHTWDGQGKNPMYCHGDILLELANK